MSRVKCEMFSHFVYSEVLTYQELLDKENELGDALREILASFGGSYISFVQDGDSLLAQCAFPEFEQSVFHGICKQIMPILDDKVAARFLFVDKYLERVSLCVADNNAWYESSLNLPANVAELLAASGHKEGEKIKKA